MTILFVLRNRWVVMWGGACAALFAGLINATSDTGSNTGKVINPPAGKIADIKPKPIYRPPEIAALSETLARPLFRQTRRPPVITPEQVKSVKRVETKPAVDFQLIGVLITPERRSALLRTAVSKSGTARVGLGDKVGAWTVTDISPTRVVVQYGKFESELHLLKDGKSRTGIAEPGTRQAK